MVAGFDSLYCEIYRRAVEDDIREVKKAIHLKLYNYGRTKINIFIDTHKGLIEKCVKESVYKEALKFPNANKRDTALAIQKIAREICRKYDIE